jgi:hypothetical protein
MSQKNNVNVVFPKTISVSLGVIFKVLRSIHLLAPFFLILVTHEVHDTSEKHHQ